MSDYFMGEIRLMSFDFAPRGWALCNGQLLPINQNQALFALLGTNFGGNGQTNFALPNMQGRVPMHVGNFHSLGESAGAESVTISHNTMPLHTHFAQARGVDGTAAIPSSSDVLANSAGFEAYRAPTSLIAMHGNTIASVGGSQPHENRQPFLVMSYCIALEGEFPTQS